MLAVVRHLIAALEDTAVWRPLQDCELISIPSVLDKERVTTDSIRVALHMLKVSHFQNGLSTIVLKRR